MFESHFISMVIFAVVVAVMLGVLRFNEKKQILQYSLKLFLIMTGSVIAGSWLMHLL